MSEIKSSDAGYTLERRDDEIAVLTLNRPDRLNALTWELIEELHGALDEVRRDPAIRVLVLTGSGKGFCAGLDIGNADPLGSNDDVVTVYDRQELVANLAIALRRLPIPVVAAVNGAAAGAGFALALASDVRICSEQAKFNAAFVRIGISACDIGVSYLLPRIVGWGIASELMLTGELIDAERAKEIGLANRVIEAGSVVEESIRFAGLITRNSPFGVRMTKQVLEHSVDAPSMEAAVQMENRTQVVATRTEDVHEAVSAFQEKREPRFQGR